MKTTPERRAKLRAANTHRSRNCICDDEITCLACVEFDMIVTRVAMPMLDDIEELQAERDEARNTAAVLVHAYDNDTRPPDGWASKAREWARK